MTGEIRPDKSPLVTRYIEQGETVQSVNGYLIPSLLYIPHPTSNRQLIRENQNGLK